jgi:hypothetical protein
LAHHNDWSRYIICPNEAKQDPQQLDYKNRISLPEMVK